MSNVLNRGLGNGCGRIMILKVAYNGSFDSKNRFVVAQIAIMTII